MTIDHDNNKVPTEDTLLATDVAVVASSSSSSSSGSSSSNQPPSFQYQAGQKTTAAVAPDNNDEKEYLLFIIPISTGMNEDSCDMRRAVIICNVLSLISSIIWMILLIVGWGVTGGGIIHFEDDVVSADDAIIITNVHAYDVTWFFAIMMTATILGLVFYSVGIWAARHYNRCGILATCIWYGIAIILSILSVNIAGVVLHALFLYPHIMLWMELKKEVITPENYQRREEQSCCCV